jgi:hypothetical protein
MEKDPNEWRNLSGSKTIGSRIDALRAYVPKTWAPSPKHLKYPVNDYFEVRYGKGGE